MRRDDTCSGWWRAAIALIALCSLVTAAAGDVRSANTESQVKAAFLYNFVQFTEWPAGVFSSADAPLIIGYFGKDPFGGALEQIVSGKTVAKRPIAVRKVSQAADFGSCHVVFVPASETRAFREMARAIADLPVLTVGESPGFADHLGIINLVTEEGHVSFEINPSAAARSHLTLSSKLLRLATIIGKLPGAR